MRNSDSNSDSPDLSGKTSRHNWPATAWGSMLNSPWSTVSWSRQVFSLFTTEAAAARRNRPCGEAHFNQKRRRNKAACWCSFTEPVNLETLRSHKTYLLPHAGSQQHVNTLLNRYCDFSAALRQMCEQGLSVDLLVRQVERRPCGIRYACRGNKTCNRTRTNITSSWQIEQVYLFDCDSLWARWYFCPETRGNFCGILLAAQEAAVENIRNVTDVKSSLRLQWSSVQM